MIKFADKLDKAESTELLGLSNYREIKPILKTTNDKVTQIFEPLFSDFSYGFRTNGRCEQAIVKLLEYFNDGYLWVVNIG